MPIAPVEPHPDQMARVEQLLLHFEQLEEQFKAVRDGLTHSHRLATLGTIASIIAHEYNNILTPIISYAQIALANDQDAPMMKKAVEKALAGAERAAKISSSLLGFAREADQEHAARLRPTIDEAVGCLAREPRKDGIDLIIDVPDVQVAISPLNLQQVMLNLILNAKKALRRRGGQLRITATVEGQLVHITVSDTGPGIPPEIYNRLFEPFATHRIEAPPGSFATENPSKAADEVLRIRGSSPSPSGRGQGEGCAPGNQKTSASPSLKSEIRNPKSEILPGSHIADSADRKGTGLGLCICRDLVRAAGGSITADPPATGTANSSPSPLGRGQGEGCASTRQKSPAAKGATGSLPASAPASSSTSKATSAAASGGATFRITLPKADDLFETT